MDRSTYGEMTTWDRRRFLGSLVASVLAAKVALPAGLLRGDIETEVINLELDFTHSMLGARPTFARASTMWMFDGKGLPIFSEDYIREHRVTDWVCSELTVNTKTGELGGKKSRMRS